MASIVHSSIYFTIFSASMQPFLCKIYVEKQEKKKKLLFSYKFGIFLSANFLIKKCNRI